jgi:hypothetical protein
MNGLTSSLNGVNVKAIIDGRIYNTDTADFVCEWSYGWEGDLRWHETALYRTKKGTFFIAGRGGPRSEWAHHEGSSSSSGSGLRVVSPEEAQCRMEDAQCREDLFAAHGFTLEEG